MRRLAAFLWLLATALAAAASAQPVVLDEPVRAGTLVFFPHVDDENRFFYAPTSARLARHGSGKPQFSFLRYVENVADTDAAQREGEGGAVLHAVVELGPTAEEVEEAVDELRRQRPGAEVSGPVIFRSGRFGLVSSFEDENGDLAEQVVGFGTAPVLDGGRAAISLQLTRLGSKILWQSLQTNTPDISFLFEMEMTGYHAPQRAVIEADLDRLYAHSALDVAAAAPVLQTAITQAFDSLYQEGAIRLTQVGEDEDLEALVQVAYSKLTELVFDRGRHGEAPNASSESALDRASAHLDAERKQTREARARTRRDRGTRIAIARGLLAKRRDDPGALAILESYLESEQEEATEDPVFSAVATYSMKRSRQRGLYRVDLNKYTADSLGVRFVHNLGDLTAYLGDDSVFRAVNLDDPFFRQREVTASLVGVRAEDFDNGLAFASLQVRKTHANGEQTHTETRIDRGRFNDLGNRFKIVYGAKGDDDPLTWRRYEYRTQWAFDGAEVVTEPWVASDFNAISLRPPFETRRVQIEATDEAALEAAGVRSISVRFPDPSGGERARQVTLNLARGQRSRVVDLRVPRGTVSYVYEIRWRLRGNRSASTGRMSTDQDILYVDELPELAPSGEADGEY